MHHGSDVEDAIGRVSLFLRALELDDMHDQELITSYHNIKVAEERIELNASDLKLLCETAWMYDDLTK